MKLRLLSLSLLLLACSLTKAQTYVSTSNKQTCYWVTSSKLFDKCGTNDEFSSMFVINADQTIITHTTNDIKSSYYVNSKDYMTECNCYTYSVTSDVGNKYTFFMDFDKNAVKILSSGHTDESDDYLILFTIKKHWTE